MLADQLDNVVGVDPHRDVHALAVAHVLTGSVVFETTVAASGQGYAQALKLVDAHASGQRAFAVEGSGVVRDWSDALSERPWPAGARAGQAAPERRSGGKTDALDAVRAARSVFGQERPATPRAGGERQALQALVAAREEAVMPACLVQIPVAACADRSDAWRWLSSKPLTSGPGPLRFHANHLVRRNLTPSGSAS
jgi:transposase